MNDSLGDSAERRSLLQTFSLPGDKPEVVIDALETTRGILHPSIFNHTMRVLCLAQHLSLNRQTTLDRQALAVAVLFHDSGTAQENNGDQRFEVEGADAAARFLSRWDWKPKRIKPVWQAIALHTSPGIAERFGPVAQIVREAVLVDLGRTELPVAPNPALAAELARYPRLAIEEVLPAIVVAQALEPGRAMKAPPSSWPGALLAEHLAGHEPAP